MTLSGTQEDNRDVMLKDTQGDAVTSNLNEVFPPLENIQTSNLRFHDRIITRSQIRKKNIDIFQLQSGSNSTPNGINGNFNGPAENSSPPKVCSTSDCMNGVLTTNSNSHFIVESRTGHILVENPSNKIYIKPNNKNAFIELSIENGSVYQYSGRKRVRDEVCRFSSTDNLMLDCRLVNEYFVEIESRSNTCLPVKVAVLKKGCNNEQKEIDNYFVIKRKENIPSYNDYGAFENHILGNNRDDDCRFKQNEESFAKNSEGIHEVISFNAPEQYSANYSSPTSCFPFTREMTVKNEQKSQSEMHPSEFISNDYPYLKSFPPDSFTKIESEPLQSFNKYSFENIQTKGQDLQSNTAKWNPSVDIIASDPITQILTDFSSKQFNNDQQITNPLLDRQEKTEHVNLDHNYTIKSSQNLQFDLNNCSQTIQYDTNENKEYTELRSRSLPLSTTSCPEIGMYDSQPSIADIEKFQQLAANSEASDIRKLNDILSNRMISNEPLKNNTDLNSSENKYANSANNEGGYVDSQFPTCSTSDPYSILSDLEGIHLDDIFIIRDDNQNWYQERKLIMNEENYNNMFASVPFRIKTEKPDF
ncbi:hypothetical protein HNY73_001956 [Argiope bruennichi]|uniref:Uncharacterized protein n=1 Tax=Argiope bruennichi TaxID=94029 RepID=A0A8T0FS05_ARGBR|nr:hypothetical protein HNY73_001956 [Argiope bruennichi]